MSNGLLQLSLREIAEIDDGRINEAFTQAIRRIANDCDDRPGDDRPRKVTLEITFTPVCDEKGYVDSVKSQFQIKETIPTRKSKVMDFGLRKGGIFVFQPLSPGDHRQQPLLDEESAGN